MSTNNGTTAVLDPTAIPDLDYGEIMDLAGQIKAEAAAEVIMARKRRVAPLVDKLMHGGYTDEQLEALQEFDANGCEIFTDETYQGIIEGLAEQVTQLAETLDQRDDQVTQLSAELAASQDQVQHFEAAIQQWKQAYAVLEQKVTDLDGQVTQLKQRRPATATTTPAATTAAAPTTTPTTTTTQATALPTAPPTTPVASPPSTPITPPVQNRQRRGFVQRGAEKVRQARGKPVNS